jgi:hypothetical protein
MHPQPVCKGRKHTVVTTDSPVSTGSPCTMVLTAYSALAPPTNSSCHRHRRIEGIAGPGRARKTSADLTPATGARRPHGFTVCVSVVRQRAVDRSRETRPATTIARPTLPRPPHPAPNVRDDGQRPSFGTGWRELLEMICPTSKAKNISREGWTGGATNCPWGKSAEDYSVPLRDAGWRIPFR